MNEPIHEAEIVSNAVAVRDSNALAAPELKEAKPMTPQELRAVEVSAALLPAYEKASTLEMTDSEIAALQEPFPDSMVEIRPHDGLIYIPHIHISDRLNKVLRPGKWSLPCRRHWMEGGVMYGEYILLIRGCYVGESTGGHPYQPNNPKVNYSDSLESTAAEALRRICGKRLSCGSQVWNPEYARQWQAKYAVQIHGKWSKRMGEPEPTSRPQAHQTPPATKHEQQPGGASPLPKGKTVELLLASARTKALGDLQKLKLPQVWACLVRRGAILPTEAIEGVTETGLFPTAAQFAGELPSTATYEAAQKAIKGDYDTLLHEIKLVRPTADEARAFDAVYGTPSTDEPAKPDLRTTQPAGSTDAPAVDIDSPNAPWRSFPLPFGTKAGQLLGKVDKKYLFGLWANMEVETTYEKDGKQVPRAKDKIERDHQFRMHLNHAGEHYKFTLPEDRASNVEKAVDAMRDGVDADENSVPF